MTVKYRQYIELTVRPQVTGDTDNCYTDTDGYPLTFSFYVVTDPTTNAMVRLTNPSGEGSMTLAYGPRAYQSSSNVFAAKVKKKSKLRKDHVEQLKLV